MSIKNKFIYKRKKAFTLTEIVVVIAIVGIMTGVMLVSLSGTRTDKALETAGQEVAAAVREAQNYALTGRGAGPGCNTYTFSYGGSSYDISNGSGCEVNISYELKNGVVFSGTSGSFYFLVPHGIIDIASTETITLGKNSKKVNVCVYPSGRVEATAIGGTCP